MKKSDNVIKEAVEDLKEVTSEDMTKRFVDKYNSLCNEFGLQIVFSPVFVSRDDGTFSVKLNAAIGKLPKRE